MSSPEPPTPHFVRAGGFRHAVPYLYTWRATAKGRWAGAPLLDLLAREFPRFPRAYFEAALAAGAVRLRGARAAGGELVRAGDALEHDAHRHEPPVRDARDDELELREHSDGGADGGAGPAAGADASRRERGFIVSVCKPASWPVHATGGFLKNTLQHVLEAEHGLRCCSGEGGGSDDGAGGGAGAGGGGDREDGGGSGGGGTRSSDSGGISGGGSLRMLYRIDRLASGLVLFASSQRVCAAFLARLQSGGVRKLYLARVAGRLEAGTLAASARFRDDPDVDAAPAPLRSWAHFRAEMLGLREEGRPEASGLGARDGERGAAAAARGPALVLLAPHVLSVRHPVCPAAGKGKRGRFFAGAAARAARADAASAEGRRGKESATDVVPVAYDEATDSTLVLALPRTGRTHQIRVHLEGLGHAIVDDPAYGGRAADLRDGRGAVPRGHAPEAAEALREALASQRRAASSGPEREALDRCPACAAEVAVGGGGGGGGGGGEGGGEGSEDEGDGGDGGGDGAAGFRGAISLHALAYVVGDRVFKVRPPAWWLVEDPLRQY